MTQELPKSHPGKKHKENGHVWHREQTALSSGLAEQRQHTGNPLWSAGTPLGVPPWWQVCQWDFGSSRRADKIGVAAPPVGGACIPTAGEDLMVTSMAGALVTEESSELYRNLLAVCKCLGLWFICFIVDIDPDYMVHWLPADCILNKSINHFDSQQNSLFLEQLPALFQLLFNFLQFCGIMPIAYVL